jgi:hypothetical protein
VPRSDRRRESPTSPRAALRRDYGRSGRTATQPVALLLDGGPAAAADRAGDTGSQLELLVGRVHDRVHVERRDVALASSIVAGMSARRSVGFGFAPRAPQRSSCR